MDKLARRPAEYRRDIFSEAAALLLYFNKDFPIYLPDITSTEDAPTTINLAIQNCKQHGPFTRIWTYCSWNDTAKQLA